MQKTTGIRSNCLKLRLSHNQRVRLKQKAEERHLIISPYLRSLIMVETPSSEEDRAIPSDKKSYLYSLSRGRSFRHYMESFFVYECWWKDFFGNNLNPFQKRIKIFD